MKKKLLAIISAASVLLLCDKWLNRSELKNKLLDSESMQFFNKKITARGHHSNERFFRENPLIILLFMVFATVLLFNGGLQDYMRFFQTSIVQTRYTTEPFDGAVYPVDKVPKWTDLTTAERSYSYSQLSSSKFMSLPRYSITDFKNGLTWRSDNERQRNAYITYPVPNLGNYKLDGSEGTGSHTGVDIKLPTGTPIKSISAGVVTKSESLTTGFGKHIVIMHKDVPDPENPAKKVTLFSSYAHLSQIKVRVGSKVTKGQIIGLSGATGMATAPHLHFQIDRAEAPFHPYWPISWNDVVRNKMSSFYEAVKGGVNKNKAKQYTVNPMNLISSTSGYNPTISTRLIASAGRTEEEISRDSSSKEDARATTTIKKTNTNYNISTNRRIRIPVRNNSRSSLAFKRDAAPVTNNRIRIASRRTTSSQTNTLHSSADKTSKTVKTASAVVDVVEEVKDGSEKNISTTKMGDSEMWFESTRSFVPGSTKNIKLFIENKNLIPSSGITISTNSRDFIKITPTVARKEAFVDGFLEIKVLTSSKKPFRLIVNAKNKILKSSTLLAQPFVDVPALGKERSAVQYVKDKNIMKGFTNGEFKPNNSLNRAESIKVIIASNNIRLIPAKKSFNDVKTSDWFGSYVTTAVTKGFVSGYDGNVFKPAREVTLAEFLKMALVAQNINPSSPNFSPYKDVPADSWYSKYFSFARSNGLVTKDSKGFVYPNKPITRIKAAYIIYKLSQL